MENRDVILIIGIVAAVIWLGFCAMTEEKSRKNVFITGIAIDTILFILCRKWELLLIGIAGGVLGGLFPLAGIRRYTKALREMKSIKNLMIACTIFFVMIFMIIALLYPELKIDWK